MKKINILFSLLILMVLFTGCSNSSVSKTNLKKVDSKTYVYYLDNKETQVVSEVFSPEGTTMEEQLKEYAQALRERKPTDLTYKKALPDYVAMEIVGEVENKQLTLNFDRNYSNLKGASEILCRAAIVKTFCQVEGVEYVQFLVDGQPLTNVYDLPVGFMKAEDFIDNTGGEVKYEQNATVVLYFANPAGDQLMETRVKIKYDGTIPMEQLVLNQLIKGPLSIEGVREGQMLATLPDKTVLNKTTVKDGICYVDVSSDFLKGVEGVKAEISLYSIVNSLVEIPEVNKVQLTVDGQQIATYGDGIAMDVALERNLDLVEKSE